MYGETIECNYTWQQRKWACDPAIFPFIPADTVAWSREEIE